MQYLRRHPVVIVLSVVLLLALLLWALWGNRALTLTHYSIKKDKLPSAFDGFRIAQVSDLHNEAFGTGNERLLSLLKEAGPDLIVITGDLIDSRKTRPEVALDFVRAAADIAPVCYAPGNHEARCPEVYTRLKSDMEGLAVAVLENGSRILEKGGQRIVLTGLTDPDFALPWPALGREDFQIVLSHRPELFTHYGEQGFDLVFAGHAHGGQFRLPLLGGLYAPHQGFFPAYTSGVHTQGSTTMVVSRGLGNSLFPLRLGNRPELVIVTLECI